MLKCWDCLFVRTVENHFQSAWQSSASSPWLATNPFCVSVAHNPLERKKVQKTWLKGDELAKTNIGQMGKATLEVHNYMYKSYAK